MLNIKEGIIQDKTILGVPFFTKIIEPRGERNVRTLVKMEKVIGITNHNTANTKASADDNMHAKWIQGVEDLDKDYISVHFFVDEDSITQVVPIDEVTYHAGDGRGDGNYRTISIEICENGNLEKAEENGQRLNAALLLAYPELKIYKHQDWSGKYCPRKIIPHWKEFLDGIYRIRDNYSKYPPIEYLYDEGIINSPEYWKNKVDEPMPVWAIMALLERIYRQQRPR